MSQANSNTVTIVMYLNAFAELNAFQKSTQKAFRTFIQQLRDDPTLPSLHVEPLKNTKDREIRSIRINNQGCRAIVAKETRTNTYTILHIDEGHDDAYDWVAKHRLTTDMVTNTIRLEKSIDPNQMAQLLSDGFTNGSYRDLFTKFSDEDIAAFGIPESGVSVLRYAPSIEIAKIMASLLPEQARACVDLALEGYSKDDINELLADERKQNISYGFAQQDSSQEFIEAAGDNQDERNMRSMLTSNGTQQQFVVLTDDDDLERILNAPLAQWRVFLHPTQRAIAYGDYSGPARVTGGAGTGKTVVAMHRARRLAQNLIKQNSNRKVLLTTYTANLADDILDNMKLLCSENELAHIEIINLDKWLYSFLSKNTKYRVQYKTASLWLKAKSAITDKSVLGLPIDFFVQEWEQVILANGITDMNEYLAVSRRGRSERLTESQRESIWTIVEQYRQLMDERKEYDQTYAMHIAAKLLDGPYSDHKFAFVVIDEGQDFSASAYRLLRSMVGHHANDMFITSDNHQQLYGNRVSLKQCGIPIAGRSFRLKVNYRTTNEIKTAAESVGRTSGANTISDVVQAMKSAQHLQALNDSDNVSKDKNADQLEYSLTGVFEDSAQQEIFGDGISLTHGEWPEAIRCKSWDAQFHRVHEWIDKRLEQDPAAKPEGICIIVRDNQHADDWVEALLSRTSYKALKLDNKTQDMAQTPGIRVATMYRAKGLEFDYVVVADVNQCPPAGLVHKFANNEMALNQLYRQERNLLYVAMTRPRKELLVTAVG